MVALIDDEEATVKRFFKESGRVRLQPENDSMEPIYVKNVSIAGKVIGLFSLQAITVDDGAGKKAVIKRTSKGDFSVQITSNEIL